MKNLNPQKNLAPYAVLFLVAGSLLSLEVTLTRMFSIMIWYHFAYLIIGVALLGGGAAGTFLAVRQWDAETISKRVAVIGLLLSLGILLILLVINVVRFDPLDSSASVFLSLFGITSYFSVIFLVYFLGGLVIAGIFRWRPGDAHNLYFADLLGAGISALVILWMIQKLTGPGSMVFAAILVLLACFALRTEKSAVPRSLLMFLLVGELALMVFVVKNPINLPIPRSKELGRFLTLLAVDEPDQTIWNPVARVDVMPTFESDAPWVIGNVSSSYVPQKAWTYRLKFATLDGTSMTVLYEFDGDFAHTNFWIIR